MIGIERKMQKTSLKKQIFDQQTKIIKEHILKKQWQNSLFILQVLYELTGCNNIFSYQGIDHKEGETTSMLITHSAQLAP